MVAIRPDTRIGDLLKEHPALLEVLAGYAPAFEKLRNPLLRRTVGRLATLAQVARMGEVDLVDLLRTLREAVGEPQPEGGAQGLAEEETAVSLPLSAATPHRPGWLDGAQVAARLDARPLHARGENLLPVIVRAARQVPAGQVLVLDNNFEPLPLYDVLGRLGFVPWARRQGADDWQVFFYRLGPGEEASAAGEPAAGEGAPPVASVTIDVSQLTPPQPMMRVLEALAGLAPGETLLVRHVKRPMYLYSKLDEMGHRHQTWELGPDRVEILIRVGGAGGA
ncbi:MAG: DUF2249 domain-containing protein [Anaerolineae bacterium]|jgi:uncharacterized protein (DUF2249 family)